MDRQRFCDHYDIAIMCQFAAPREKFMVGDSRLFGKFAQQAEEEIKSLGLSPETHEVAIIHKVASLAYKNYFGYENPNIENRLNSALRQ